MSPLKRAIRRFKINHGKFILFRDSDGDFIISEIDNHLESVTQDYLNFINYRSNRFVSYVSFEMLGSFRTYEEADDRRIMLISRKRKN